MQDMDAVYRQHFRMVYQYLMSLTHQPDVAEELAQETFCQAVSSIHRYDGSCKITTWLCAIAKNQYLSYLRKHPLHEDLTDTEAELPHTPSAEQEALSSAGKNGIAAMPAPVSGTLPGSDLSAGIWKSLVPGNRTNYGTE